MNALLSRRTAVSLYFLTLVYVGVLVSSLGPSLPALSERTGASLGALSLLFSVRGLGFLLGTFCYARLLERFAGHRVMAVATALTVVSVALLGQAASFPLLIFLSLVYGAFEAGLDTGANTLLAWTYGARVAPYMNALHFFFGIGALLGPMLVVGILEAGRGVGAVFLTMGLMGIPLVPALWLAPSPAIVSAPKIHGGTSERHGLVLPLFFVLFFLYVGAEVAFSGWIFSIGSRVGGLSREKAGALTSLFWGTFTFGRLFSIVLSRKMKVRVVLSVALAGCLLTSLAGLALPLRGTALLCVAVSFGIFMASMFPMLMSLANEVLAISARTTALLLVASGLGGMVLPWVFGIIFDGAGARLAWLSLTFNIVMSCAIYAWLLFRIRTRAGFSGPIHSMTCSS